MGIELSSQLSKMTRDFRFVEDSEGMSPAHVYKLIGSSENLYLKVSDSRYRGTTYDVEREKDMLLWLKGKLPGWENPGNAVSPGRMPSDERPERLI